MRTRLPSVLLAALALLVSGCSSLLPRSHSTTKSRWSSFEDVQASFDRITLQQTRSGELAALGFDPLANPNIKVLTYLDIIQRFMPNQSITKEDLDPSVRACIEARERTQAWEIELSDTDSRRYGSALLDITGFVRKTHDTGWQFKGLLLMLDGRVVYKIASGQPKLDRYEKRIKPLGPLQDLESTLASLTRSFW